MTQIKQIVLNLSKMGEEIFHSDAGDQLLNLVKKSFQK